MSPSAVPHRHRCLLALLLILFSGVLHAQAPAGPAVAVAAPDAQAQANGIADSARELRAAARLLRQKGIDAPSAFRALRNVFAPSDRDNYQALQAGGYARPELARAMRDASQLDPAALDRRLAEAGEDLDSRAVLLRSVLNPSFDELLVLLHRNNPNRTNNFLPALRAMQYPIDTIVQAGHRYYSGHLLTGADGRPYPGPAALYVMARALQPSAQHYELWARLVRVGYPRKVLFNELALGSSDLRGAASDEVAICIAQRFARATEGVNPRIALVIRLDGTDHDPAQRSCYARFATKLRLQGIDRGSAAGIVELGIDCMPGSSPRCTVERAALVDRVLGEAGYAAAAR